MLSMKFVLRHRTIPFEMEAFRSHRKRCLCFRRFMYRCSLATHSTAYYVANHHGPENKVDIYHASEVENIECLLLLVCKRTEPSSSTIRNTKQLMAD